MQNTLRSLQKAIGKKDAAVKLAESLAFRALARKSLSHGDPNYFSRNNNAQSSEKMTVVRS